MMAATEVGVAAMPPSAAYCGGIVWLGNHASANVDFTTSPAGAGLGRNQPVGRRRPADPAGCPGLEAPGDSGWGGETTSDPVTTARELTALIPLMWPVRRRPQRRGQGPDRTERQAHHRDGQSRCLAGFGPLEASQHGQIQAAG